MSNFCDITSITWLLDTPNISYFTCRSCDYLS